MDGCGFDAGILSETDRIVVSASTT
jgi:hypothetical protein